MKPDDPAVFGHLDVGRGVVPETLSETGLSTGGEPGDLHTAARVLEAIDLDIRDRATATEAAPEGAR